MPSTTHLAFTISTIFTPSTPSTPSTIFTTSPITESKLLLGPRSSHFIYGSIPHFLSHPPKSYHYLTQQAQLPHISLPNSSLLQE